MTQRLGYLVDVSSIQLDDSEGTWIQAMKVGTYSHPVYGELSFTQDRLQAFAASVTGKVLKKDLDIDYDHKMRFDHAAGWVQQATVRDNGLWLYVTWTPAAKQKLQDKEYRYFSPEFVDEWTDPQTQVTYKDVLMGGALTNRPFLKDLVPINLSDMMVGEHTMGNENTPGTGGSPPTDAQNWTAVAQTLGLTGSVTSSDILAKVQQLSQPASVPQAPQTPPVPSTNITLSVPAPAPAAPPAPPAPTPVPQQVVQQAPAPVTPPAPQTPAPPAPAAPTITNLLQPIALTDELTGDPVALADVVRRQNEKIQLLGSATKLADANAKVTMLCDPGTGVALAPAVRDLAVELLVKAPVALSETVEKLLDHVAHGRATVVLGAIAGGRGAESGSTIKQFSDAVAAVQKESDNKLGYADAVEKVCRDNPALANAYREATMSGEGEA